MTGCRSDHKSAHYLGEPSHEFYKTVATTIDTPDEPDWERVDVTAPPLAIRHAVEKDVWELPIAEAIRLALANNEVLREDAQFLQPRSSLLANGEGTATLLDPAIQETGAIFGQRGVEAALADFDAQFATQMLWGRSELVQNSAVLSGGIPPGSELTDETAGFTSRIEKPFANGGRFAVQHNWDYSLNNRPNLLFGSAYDGFLRTEYRQPLLAGAGTFFNRVAGPLQAGLDVQRVDQGVVIARINNDISLADLEQSVRILLRDVENLYWDLVFTYRVYDAEVVARDSALATWREAKARLDTGTGGSADEAQARDNYFEARSRVEQALADVYATESRLRRLIGLPVDDGLVIRPAEEPNSAEFAPDWYLALVDALTQRPELRRQKWVIKSLELQHRAAENLTRPRFDLVAAYQVNGFGDKLLAYDDDDGTTAQGFNSAYETLTQGNQTGWNLGAEFSMPIGFRAAHTQVRNVELRLRKAHKTLATQELDITHELSVAYQNLDRWYQTMQTNYNRRLAAAERVQAYEAEYRVGRTLLDLVLRSQQSLAQAEIAYFRSLLQYNKAIAEFQFRAGTLLEYDNVHLTEGPWSRMAAVDACERNRARRYAIRTERLKHAEPAPFARPENRVPVSLDVQRAVQIDDAVPEVSVSPESPVVPPAPGLESMKELP